MAPFGPLYFLHKATRPPVMPRLLVR